MRTKKYLALEANDKATHWKIEVYYSKGGMNYFSSTNESRGIWVSVSPVTRKENSESFTAFSGIKQHILDMARFSQKKFDSVVIEPELEQKLIDVVCQKNNIKVLETTN